MLASDPKGAREAEVIESGDVNADDSVQMRPVFGVARESSRKAERPA